MNQPFNSFHYDLEVVTPVHIGAAKENDYIFGQDYFFEDGYYCFVDKRKLMKQMSSQDLDAFTKTLLDSNGQQSANIIKSIANRNKETVIYRSYCPSRHVQESIRKHISDGFGNLIIPGSSLKGAISGIIGKFLMSRTNTLQFNSTVILGGINNSIMRFLQVGDATFRQYGEVTLQKIYSADLVQAYSMYGNTGDGMWKHDRIGGHGLQFNESGFVTAAEMLIEQSNSEVRINWADGLLSIIPGHSRHQSLNYFNEFSKENLLEIIRKHTKEYLEQEMKFFENFPNDDFPDVIDILENIKIQNQEENSAIIRLGSGSGFHAITGNWKYRDHTMTEQAEGRQRNLINAIKYKTRKVSFYDDNSGNPPMLTLPGFVKIKSK